MHGKVSWISAASLAVACVAMALVPSPAGVSSDGGKTVLAKVVSTDDSAVQLAGIVEYGTQRMEVEILGGKFAGRRFRAENELRAQLDIDKKFRPGDVAVVGEPSEGADGEAPLFARDHWRLGWAAALFAAFAALLCAFGGWTGVKALFSFAFSCLAVWKVLVPLCLAGRNASLVSFATVAVLTAAVMLLVAGATKKGAVAFIGAMLGVASSFGLAALFTSLMHVTGATLPYVQALVNSGYPELDLADIFVGATVLASSGAVMDLAMDISAGQCEVAMHDPSIGFKRLLASGLRMGRAVVGTMTTTLLLAYSGGYLTLLMAFAAQGTSPLAFLNSTLLSAELVKTIVGSFGLVLVAPFTALVGASLYGKNTHSRS